MSTRMATRSRPPSRIGVMAAIRVYYRPWIIGLGQGAGVWARLVGVRADFIRTMSQQRFSDIERRALWEAHRKRCLYCASPLLFKVACPPKNPRDLR